MVRKPRNVKTEVQDGQALELRKAGASYDQIAKQLGFAHKSGAHHSVMRALKASIAMRNAAAEDVLEIELQRLDEMLLGLWADARKGRWLAVDRVLKIMERRAMFLGLDAPKRSEVSGPDGAAIQIDAEVHVELSPDQRLERIRYLFESQQAETARFVLGDGSAVAPEPGSTNGRVA